MAAALTRVALLQDLWLRDVLHPVVESIVLSKGRQLSDRRSTRCVTLAAAVAAAAAAAVAGATAAGLAPPPVGAAAVTAAFHLPVGSVNHSRRSCGRH